MAKLQDSAKKRAATPNGKASAKVAPQPLRRSPRKTAESTKKAEAGPASSANKVVRETASAEKKSLAAKKQTSAVGTTIATSPKARGRPRKETTTDSSPKKSARRSKSPSKVKAAARSRSQSINTEPNAPAQVLSTAASESASRKPRGRPRKQDATASTPAWTDSPRKSSLAKRRKSVGSSPFVPLPDDQLSPNKLRSSPTKRKQSIGSSSFVPTLDDQLSSGKRTASVGGVKRSIEGQSPSRGGRILSRSPTKTKPTNDLPKCIAKAPAKAETRMTFAASSSVVPSVRTRSQSPAKKRPSSVVKSSAPAQTQSASSSPSKRAMTASDARRSHSKSPVRSEQSKPTRLESPGKKRAASPAKPKVRTKSPVKKASKASASASRSRSASPAKAAQRGPTRSKIPAKGSTASTAKTRARLSSPVERIDASTATSALARSRSTSPTKTKPPSTTRSPSPTKKRAANPTKSAPRTNSPAERTIASTTSTGRKRSASPTKTKIRSKPQSRTRSQSPFKPRTHTLSLTPSPGRKSKRQSPATSCAPVSKPFSPTSTDCFPTAEYHTSRCANSPAFLAAFNAPDETGRELRRIERAAYMQVKNGEAVSQNPRQMDGVVEGRAAAKRGEERARLEMGLRGQGSSTGGDGDQEERASGGNGPTPESSLRGPIHSTTNPPFLPHDPNPNPFFETLPLPEVWHRHMPPYFPFGETPAVERAMSAVIDADLSRGREEDAAAEKARAKKRSSLGGRLFEGAVAWGGGMWNGIARPLFGASGRAEEEEDGEVVPEPWGLPGVEEGEVLDVLREVRKVRAKSSGAVGGPKRKFSGTGAAKGGKVKRARRRASRSPGQGQMLMSGAL